ncbi:DNA polymerase III subunit [Winogradskyella aurantiaca]|uniref:DNA polymerase III subunit n=1 Tax=Winogradskyella aurantiaca TaxID=2219558 RepID=UPI000E1D391F|nr:DNA polymerase III subunit delta' [Winogradskyella aurantiaca]
MEFSEVLGHEHIKSYLKKGVDTGRIAHAQLFVGPEGSGTLPMALAYASYLLKASARSTESHQLMMENFTHPDMHFAFPVTTTSKVSKHPVSNHYLTEWRELLKTQPYGNLFDWYKLLGVENKQGLISVNEAHEIVKSLALKSFEGGYKVMIIWMPEKMNNECANKLLKLIEEPPSQTLFVLVAEDEEQLIDTIRSRCQIIHFPPLSENDIVEGLVRDYDVDSNVAQKIAHQSEGNYNKACDLVYRDSEDLQFEKWFVIWVRSAFKAKGNKSAIHDLITWSEEIAKTGRETQKQFLLFCLSYFRQALLLNYKATELVYMEPQVENFKLEKFAPFVHNSNIMEITDELEKAVYHIERNGNSKIILTDLSIKLTRLLHRKSVA